MVEPSPPAGRDIAYHGFRTAAGFDAGTFRGSARSAGGIVLVTPAGHLDHTDPHTGRVAGYDLATWTSPAVRPGFAATEVIPSWTADTPGGCWLQIELSGITEDGRNTGWYVLGRWAADDHTLRRGSLPDQRDADGAVDADTLVAAAGRALVGWRVRATLLRPAGTTLTPTLRSVGAVASRLPGPVAGTPRRRAEVPGRDGDPRPTAPGPLGPAGTPDRTTAQTPRPPAMDGSGRVLDVPPFSQRIHAGHYPQWNGGGNAWCSPTSTAMVLAFWGTGPEPRDYAWVDPADPRPCVDHAARQCFDHAYGGAGNWPFNTAYAGRFGLDAFVTRLRSLAEAALFIDAGVPLVISASYREGDVPGLDYHTDGHLMVLVGFTGAGHPVLNDPYAPTEAAVRRCADRARFEAAWLTASGGLVYVIHPPAVPLPPARAQANW